MVHGYWSDNQLSLECVVTDAYTERCVRSGCVVTDRCVRFGCVVTYRCVRFGCVVTDRCVRLVYVCVSWAGV